MCFNMMYQICVTDYMQLLVERLHFTMQQLWTNVARSFIYFGHHTYLAVSKATRTMNFLKYNLNKRLTTVTMCLYLTVFHSQMQYTSVTVSCSLSLVPALLEQLSWLTIILCYKIPRIHVIVVTWVQGICLTEVQQEIQFK